MKLVVVGAGGRMGQSLVRIIHESEVAQLSGAIERSGSDCLGKDAGELAGVGHLDVPIVDDPLPVFAQAEGVIDFTIPEASIEFAGLAAQARIVHVIGTTGCTDDDEAKFAAAARHATIIKSGNMSLGVNLLAALVEQAAKSLGPEEFDIDVLEMHHKHKIDAPSGTALMLGHAAAEGRQIDMEKNAVKSRNGIIGARETGSIGFATLRGGSVIGEHSVLFAGEGEVIELSHRATDRALFARGALRAALWGKGRKPGMYSMKDVLGLN